MTAKSVFRAILIGGAIAEILVTWLGPKYIVWFFEPPVQFGISCREPLTWALGRMQMAQIIALGLGAAFGLITLLMFRRRRANNNQYIG
jgi:hypothetical protein